MDELPSKSTVTYPDILVVDDKPDNLKILVGMLDTCGYRVRPVPSGALALQVAKAEPPDLILLDVQMPGMNGYDVCRALKKDKRLATIPVIFLSALSEPESRLKAFDAGGVDYISKPFSIDEVLARVKTHVKLAREEKERQVSYDKLKELETLRDDLVHMLIHDLRSPLTGIAQWLRLVKEDTQSHLTPDSRKFLEMALMDSRRMIQMLNAMLEMNKFEPNQMSLVISECNVALIAQEALASQQVFAEDRKLVLKGPGFAFTWADKGILFRVFQNLIGNALRFTPPDGEVQVAIEIDGDWVCARVTDYGPGIPKDLQDRIFQKSGQVDAPALNGVASTGLGLPFCKLAIETHGGSLGVDSEPGMGSSFWFRLRKSPS